MYIFIFNFLYIYILQFTKKRAVYALSPDIYYALSATLQSEKVPGKKRGPYNKTRD